VGLDEDVGGVDPGRSGPDDSDPHGSVHGSVSLGSRTGVR
jgi:hypothetical protein